MKQGQMNFAKKQIASVNIMTKFMNQDKIKEEVENKIKTDYRNGEIDEAKEKERFDDCDHQCSGNCRREGCNCDCGEWHIPYAHKKEVYDLIGYAVKEGFIGDEAEFWDWDSKEAYFEKCQAYEPPEEQLFTGIRY